MDALTGKVLFALLICLITAVRLWLVWRQIRYVSLHRNNPPFEFSAFISLEAHQKSADYTIAKAKFSSLQLIVTAAITLWLTVGGGLNWLCRLLNITTDTVLILQTILIFGSVFFLTGVVDLFFDYHRVFGIETRFGFNRSTLRIWITDQIRGTLLSILLGLPLLLAAVYFMTWAKTTWWFWLWLILIAFNITIAAIYPKFIAPLFNRFEPLQDDGLKQRIQGLLEKNQFRSDGLFVMDGSRRSAHGNAYFTGFGSAKRIVFFDTLLAHLSHDEIIAVLAHELGHLRKKHIWQQMGILALVSFVFLYILNELTQSPLFYTFTNVDVPNAAVTLLLLIQLSPFLLFPLTPVLSILSRKNEFEADRFACTQAPANDLINALLKLFKENAATLTPDPLYSAVYDSHPSALTRIRQLKESNSE